MQHNRKVNGKNRGKEEQKSKLLDACMDNIQEGMSKNHVPQILF